MRRPHLCVSVRPDDQQRGPARRPGDVTQEVERAAATVAGRAQLVDGQKKNKVSLHMRHLAARTTCTRARCAAPGPPAAGWIYRTQVGTDGTLKSRRSGTANTRGKSATFSADPTKSYSVNVYVSMPMNGLAAGTIIACGDLKASKAGGKGKKPHPATGKGPKR
jgi:hypothetical protein